MEETLILKIVTKSKKKSLQMIVPVMGHEVYILKDDDNMKGFMIDHGFWKHLKKKGK